MKKQIFTLGLMLAATFTLTNCDKISENEQIAKNDFTIFASPAQETKTAGDGVHTSWVADDGISVMHAVAGSTTYVNDGKFVIAEEDIDTGRFTGELGEELSSSKSYDWYMFYPYSGKMESPVNSDKCYFYIGCGAGKSQNQNGNSNMDHLAGYDFPLYGTIKNLPASSTPEVTMHHLCAAVAFNVTNKSGKDMTVQSIEFTSTESINGTFYIDIAGEPKYKDSGASYVSSTAKLAVNEGAVIKNGKSAKFYMVVKPHTVKKGGKMSVKVATNTGVYENEISASSAATFVAGKIQTINVEYKGGSSSDVQTITCAEFIRRADEKTTYRLVGEVVSDVNKTYCSFDMNDGTGKVVVWTVNNKDEWKDIVKKGGTVTVRGKYQLYTDKSGNTKDEMIDAYIEDFKEGTGGGTGGSTGGDDEIDGYKFEWSAPSVWSGIGGDEISYTVGGYTVKGAKAEGANPPTVNSTANDFRSYAKNTVTVSGTKTMTKIVFKLSSKGKNRLADIEPSKGTVSYDTEAWTVTWTGSATSVTFTVGETATHGTDGASAAGQFDFDYVAIK